MDNMDVYRYLEKRVPKVEVVRCQSQVVQEIVGIRLGDVRPVEVETEEHDTRPDHDQPVDLANDALATYVKPGGGIET